MKVNLNQNEIKILYQCVIEKMENPKNIDIELLQDLELKIGSLINENKSKIYR